MKKLSNMLYACWVLVVALQYSGNAQVPVSLGDELEHLFQSALTKSAPAYIEIRSNIISNPNAVPFLTDKCTSTNLHSRVLAGAMLEWATNSVVNKQRESILCGVVTDARRSRMSMMMSVLAKVYGFFDPSAPGHFRQPRSVLHDKASVPFLLEMALKGPSDLSRYKDLNSRVDLADGYPYVIWDRCFAAGLVGGYGGDDTINILIEILASDKPLPVRLGASTGLRRSNSPRAIKPFIDALRDNDKDIREIAAHDLKQLTGQDFGMDQGKYQEWWAANKDRLLSSTNTPSVAD